MIYIELISSGCTANTIKFVDPLIIVLPFIIIISAYYTISKACKINKIKKKGFNFILTNYGYPEVEMYILKQLKNYTNINNFYSKNPSDYPHFEGNLSIRHIDNPEFYFNLTKGARKFKYKKTKIDNIISKLIEYDRKVSQNESFSSRSQLNLSNTKEGFGHIQHSQEVRGNYKQLQEVQGNYKSESRLSKIIKNMLLAVFGSLILVSFIRGILHNSK